MKNKINTFSSTENFLKSQFNSNGTPSKELISQINASHVSQVLASIKDKIDSEEGEILSSFEQMSDGNWKVTYTINGYSAELKNQIMALLEQNDR